MRAAQTCFPAFLVVILSCGVLLALVPEPAIAKPPACKAVFGIGDLSVAEWMDGEPFVVGGEFQVAIDSADRMIQYLESDPGQLIWFDGELTLMAMPGSDAPLPGEMAWSPCSSTWGLSRAGGDYTVESFCESTMVPTAPGGTRYFEFFIREEVAVVEPGGSAFTCGRLHLNGIWDADLDEASEVTVAGKLCKCP